MNLRIIAPLGVGRMLNNNGIDKVFELNWWEENVIDSDITIHAVQAQHFSARGLI
ncbi:MAG: hypothetical protein U5K71_15010 [Gracilimonas sp.]|nr:hypothetical protein [Gracilimonas sp.]